jgi:hypothetical protein
MSPYRNLRPASVYTWVWCLRHISVFDGSGIHWSELLHLPYFDISHSIIDEAMHNLFLGLIKEHFDRILGIHLVKAEEAPILQIDFSMS